MSNSGNGAAPASGPGSPIAEALDKNKQATEEVKKAVDDLAVVHAVLETRLADKDKPSVDADVGRAVAKTHKVEQQLARSAEKLDAVNDTLAREASARR